MAAGAFFGAAALGAAAFGALFTLGWGLVARACGCTLRGALGALRCTVDVVFRGALAWAVGALRCTVDGAFRVTVAGAFFTEAADAAVVFAFRLARAFVVAGAIGFSTSVRALLEVAFGGTPVAAGAPLMAPAFCGLN